MEDFRRVHERNTTTIDRLNNKVKVCAGCGKPCAYTLAACNSCGTSLLETPITFNDNVFMGFIFGIAKGKFPYEISIRKETREFLCFDDPLSLSLCHLNVIPADLYCRDWRYLFTNPQKGRDLLERMLRFACQAAFDSYWSHANFHRKILGGRPPPAMEGMPTEVDVEKMKYHLTIGCNFPPSMYQLHLQFIHMPHSPFHADMARAGNHYSHGRFFPYEYLIQALALGDAVKMEVTDDTPIEQIMDRVLHYGVDYDRIHRACVEATLEYDEQHSPWRAADFQYVVSNGVVRPREGVAPPEIDAKAIQKDDNLKIQNYGRPYEDGKPRGTYYKFPKDPRDVGSF